MTDRSVPQWVNRASPGIFVVVEAAQPDRHRAVLRERIRLLLRWGIKRAVNLDEKSPALTPKLQVPSALMAPGGLRVLTPFGDVDCAKPRPAMATIAGHRRARRVSIGPSYQALGWARA